ncbi:LacI family DNA-binding transcriptional regulator [Bifidobacterium simiarum]|uniref:LacI family transcriptional regulator n=1 Tax=Bifidobacterium simiarum TaxID=2045441 RepID=A0A2M9HFD7_9BIFI|nr:LacI family DNA-binding transcriptional regulator [Bifidobacterium simiarum]PJM75530.1 LacI family transcriptional regulator [Bifidobacterium simiarum]
MTSTDKQPNGASPTISAKRDDDASKRIGISDVAKKADVSIGTVSNYLNYPDRVSDRLKIKIQKAIEDLGYVRTQKRKIIERQIVTPLIGYVITDVENYLFTSILEGIQEICEANDMEVIGVHSMSDKTRQSEQVRMLCQMNVSGLIISAVDDSQDDIAFARAAGIPAIMIDHRNPSFVDDHCTVLKNDTAAGEIAAHELISTGCRHLAYVANDSNYQPIQQRQTGIERVTRATDGVTLEVIDSGGLMFEDGYEIGRRLSSIQNSDRPDGIVAGSDRVASGIISALTDAGIQIPEEISVIGTEGDRLESRCPMSLTVVESPGVDMGRRAMTLMLDEIANPAGHVHSTQLLMPKLIRRASTR